MSTYQGIRGLKIRDYTTNPDDPLEGQLWYNKTDQVGKYQIPKRNISLENCNNLNNTRDEGGRIRFKSNSCFDLCWIGSNPPPTMEHRKL